MKAPRRKRIFHLVRMKLGRGYRFFLSLCGRRVEYNTNNNGQRVCVSCTRAFDTGRKR